MNEAHHHTPKTYHKLVMVTLTFMSLGTLSELLLIGHYEDQWQLIPIIIITLIIIMLVITAISKSEVIVKFFRILMGLCIASGAWGVWFHLNANLEFEKELHPSLSGWTLIKESLSGAIPALAPGSIMALGLVGYLFTLTINKQQ